MAICTTQSVDTGKTFLGIMYNSINLHEHIQSVLYHSMEQKSVCGCFSHEHQQLVLHPVIIIVGLPNEDLQMYINLLKNGQEEEGPVRIKYETLDAETAFYWRCLGEHVKTMGVDGEELLDELLPEVSGFCKYIQGYVFCMTVKAVNYMDL